VVCVSTHAVLAVMCGRSVDGSGAHTLTMQWLLIVLLPATHGKAATQCMSQYNRVLTVL
jgi:hypothetical protein